MVDLSLPQVFKGLFHFIAKVPIELYNASLSWLSDVLKGMLETFRGKIKRDVQLVLWDVGDFSQDPCKRLVPINDQFVRVHGFLGSFGSQVRPVTCLDNGSDARTYTE